LSTITNGDGGLLGVLAFGDSITNGGGELQWGVALQSWALWVARGLGLPFTTYAVDGAQAADVVAGQIPAFRARTAHPEARYELGCLYIGVNDVRAAEWDPAAFERSFRVGLEFLRERCEIVLSATPPSDLGLPPAGAKVQELNAVIERVAGELGARVVDLRGFRGRNVVMADRVHPTALGQVAIAERALAVLRDAGLPTRVRPSSLVSFETTAGGRLRADGRYVLRYSRNRLRPLLIRLTTGRRRRPRSAAGQG
jgi:lysophospholipase L1-like esterase